MVDTFILIFGEIINKYKSINDKTITKIEKVSYILDPHRQKIFLKPANQIYSTNSNGWKKHIKYIIDF